MELLIYLVIVLIVVGVLLYLVNNFLPMDGKIKQLLNVAVIVIMALWVLAKLLPHLVAVLP
jgi:hypothetical protein